MRVANGADIFAPEAAIPHVHRHGPFGSDEMWVMSVALN